MQNRTTYLYLYIHTSAGHTAILHYTAPCIVDLLPCFDEASIPHDPVANWIRQSVGRLREADPRLRATYRHRLTAIL